MKMSMEHLKRYRQLITLFWKYGRGDLVEGMDIGDALASEDPALAEAKSAAGRGHDPAELADDLEAMGPTFVKLGQILAGRPDLLPAPYLKALARLQDDVKPFPYADVERIVEEELKVRISKAFAAFDREPLAAASLGQVHLATLRDGRQVVVKVQRPGIPQVIADDFAVLADIATFLDRHTSFGRRYRVCQVLEEFRLTLQQELNYEREAHNLRTLGRNLAAFPHIHVPQPVDDYCTRRVLTMDHVTGRKITRLGPLTHLEAPAGELAEELFKAYLQQVLVDGLFHADPHPGNVFLTHDHRIALLDLGMVGTTTPAMQDNLLKILLAVSEGKSEDAATVVIAMSETSERFDEATVRRHVGRLVMSQREQALADLNIGRTLLMVSQVAAENGLFVPAELTLLGKTLLQLDEVGKILHPGFDPNAAIRRHAGNILTQRMRKQATQGSAMSSLLDVKDFVAALPGRLNRIMDAVAGSELEVKVRAVDADLVMEGFQKIANRITTGLILAALIIGASLLMRVDTAFTLFGYPGLAILCFLAAAAGGFWLVIGIFVQDHQSKRRLRKATPT